MLHDDHLSVLTAQFKAQQQLSIKANSCRNYLNDYSSNHLYVYCCFSLQTYIQAVGYAATSSILLPPISTFTLFQSTNSELLMFMSTCVCPALQLVIFRGSNQGRIEVESQLLCYILFLMLREQTHATISFSMVLTCFIYAI